MKLTLPGILLMVVCSSYAQELDLTRAINSKYDEQNPVLMPGSTHLFYTIANHPNNVGGTKDKGDIWYSVWQDSSWSMPIHAGNVINNTLWNGVLDFSADGKTMLLHHRYGNGKQGISVAKRNSNSWQSPKDVDIPYFMNKSEFQSGSLSPDGNVLLLGLESYGTIGAEDIYICFKKGNKWSEPKNLGGPINTKFQEMTPIVADDNKTLFFSSNGHGGAGSMDVFKTQRMDDTWLNWSKPENVSEVNTSGRELSFTFNPVTQMARFVTTQDSDGYGDIRYYEFKEPITDSAIVVKMETIDTTTVDTSLELSISGTVKNKTTLELISAEISITSMTYNLNSPLIKIANNGEFNLVIDSAGRYQIKVSAQGFLPHLAVFELDSTTTTKHFETMLSPVVVGEAITLENVLFERASTTMIASSYKDLDDVVELMKDNPSMEIELSGHTDNQGSSKLNLQLSKDRVEAVKDYFISKGISSKRIEGNGYGGTRPIASNKNPESRKLNRRVEFTVVKE